MTGSRTRAAGLADLDRELDRCRRIDCSLVVAYVDVVGLKALNDSEGHAAGDELLKRVVTHIQAHVRSYDLIIRLRRRRVSLRHDRHDAGRCAPALQPVAGALAASPDAGAMRTGFAQLLDDDGAGELIARADSELLDGRRDRKRQ